MYFSNTVGRIDDMLGDVKEISVYTVVLNSH